MVVETRVFGTIEIAEEKVITFSRGIIGFPELKRFTLIYDTEKNSAGGIKWLQSLDEPGFAMPVMDPLAVNETYSPMVEDDLLKDIGELDPEEILVLCTVSVPKDITKISVNLQAPIVINAATRKAVQIIVDDASGKYPVKYMIYDILQEKKEKAGE